MRCPLCKSSQVLPVQCSFPGVQACKNCEFLFATNTEDSSDPALYDEEWARTEVHPTFVCRDGEFVVRNESKLRTLLSDCERFRRLNRILDVGCSAAFFLKMAAQRRWM